MYVYTLSFPPHPHTPTDFRYCQVSVTSADENVNTIARCMYCFDARGSNFGCLGDTAWATIVSHLTQFNDVLVSPVTKTLQIGFVKYELAVAVEVRRGGAAVFV